MVLQKGKDTTFDGKQKVHLKMYTVTDSGSHSSNNTECQQETRETTTPQRQK